MKVKELVARLLQFEQDAELELLTGPCNAVELGSVYDDTEDSAIYWPVGMSFESVATKVVVELDPKRIND
jgi:hypothetical protein